MINWPPRALAAMWHPTLELKRDQLHTARRSVVSPLASPSSPDPSEAIFIAQHWLSSVLKPAPPPARRSQFIELSTPKPTDYLFAPPSALFLSTPWAEGPAGSLDNVSPVTIDSDWKKNCHTKNTHLLTVATDGQLAVAWENYYPGHKLIRDIQRVVDYHCYSCASLRLSSLRAIFDLRTSLLNSTKSQQNQNQTPRHQQRFQSFSACQHRRRRRQQQRQTGLWVAH